jgi:hypothetical protein
VVRRGFHLLLERIHFMLQLLELFSQIGFLLFPLSCFRFIRLAF